MFTGIWPLAKKELRQVSRDRRSLVLILVVPALLTILFGVALGGGRLQGIPIDIVNEDGSAASNVLVTMLSSHDALRIRSEEVPLATAQALLAHGQIKAALVIPRGFMHQLQARQMATIQLLLDGTDTTAAPIVEGVAQRVVARYNMERALRRLAARGMEPNQGRRLLRSISLVTIVRYNPGLQYLSYAMPGVIGITLQLLTVMLMAISIPREREEGTLDLLMASPLSRTELIGGKLLPYFGLALFNVATILWVANWGFGIPVMPHLVLLVTFCALFVLASLATGLLIAGVSRSQFQAVQLAVFYILPVFLLSGAYAPLALIPVSVRPLSYLFPLLYFCQAVRAMTLRGAGLALVWKDMVILGGFVVVLLYWAALSLQKCAA